MAPEETVCVKRGFVDSRDDENDVRIARITAPVTASTVAALDMKHGNDGGDF